MGGGPKFGVPRNEDQLRRIPDEEVSGEPHKDDPKAMLRALGAMQKDVPRDPVRDDDNK